MNHSPWDGVTVADFVMPFFLFIVGVALALAYKV
jgi:predicted acyltransferase